MKSRTRSFFADRIALGITVLGLGLMAISRHYNVNPVDVGAIRGGVQNHPVILWTLAITTIPAMMMAIIVCGLFMKMPDWAPVFLPMVFVCQFVLSFVGGKILSIAVRLVRTIGKKGPQPTFAGDSSTRADAGLGTPGK